MASHLRSQLKSISSFHINEMIMINLIGQSLCWFEHFSQIQNKLKYNVRCSTVTDYVSEPLIPLTTYRRVLCA